MSGKAWGALRWKVSEYRVSEWMRGSGSVVEYLNGKVKNGPSLWKSRTLRWKVGE